MQPQPRPGAQFAGGVPLVVGGHFAGSPTGVFAPQLLLNPAWGGQPRLDTRVFALQATHAQGQPSGQVPHTYAAGIPHGRPETHLPPFHPMSGVSTMGFADNPRAWMNDLDYSRPERYDSQRNSPPHRRSRDGFSRDYPKDGHRDYRRDRDHERDRSRERARQRDKERDREKERDRDKDKEKDRHTRGTPRKATKLLSASKSNASAEDAQQELVESKDRATHSDSASLDRVENALSTPSEGLLESKDTEKMVAATDDCQGSLMGRDQESYRHEQIEEVPAESTTISHNSMNEEATFSQSSTVLQKLDERLPHHEHGKKCTITGKSTIKQDLSSKESQQISPKVSGKSGVQQEGKTAGLGLSESPSQKTQLSIPTLSQLSSYDMGELQSMYEQARQRQESMEAEFFRLRQNLLESCVIKEELQRTADTIRTQLQQFKENIIEKQEHKKSLEQKLIPLELELEKIRRAVIEKKIESTHYQLAEQLSQQENEQYQQHESTISITLAPTPARNAELSTRHIPSTINPTNQ